MLRGKEKYGSIRDPSPDHHIQCRYCHKTFSSSSNRHRHEKSLHSNVKPSKAMKRMLDECNDSDEWSDSDNVIAKKIKAGKATNITNDKEDSDNKDKSSTQEAASSVGPINFYDDDYTLFDTNDSKRSWGYWEELVSEAIQQISDGPEDAKEILKESYFDEFLESLYELVDKQLKFVDYMTKNDPVFKQIQGTARRYMAEMAIGQGEAFEKAWNDRKYLLKRYLRHHIGDIQNEIFDGKKDEEESNDDDESEDKDDDSGDDDEDDNDDDGNSANDEGEDENRDEVDDQNQADGSEENLDSELQEPQKVFVTRMEECLET